MGFVLFFVVLAFMAGAVGSFGGAVIASLFGIVSAFHFYPVATFSFGMIALTILAVGLGNG